MGILNRSGTDMGLAVYMCQLLQMLRQPGYTVPIGQSLAQAEATPVYATSGGDPINVPPWYAAQVGLNRIVLISCTQGVQMAASLIEGYGNPVGPRPYTYNPYIQGCRDQIKAAIDAQPSLGATRRTIYAGYSLGGAIAQDLARLDQLNDATQSTLCITFGAPKLGSEDYLVQLERVSGARYMNSEDGVPLVPPTISDYPMIATAFNNLQLVNFSQFQQGPLGIVLTTTGAVISAAYPQVPLLAGILNFGAFLLSQVTNISSGHALSLYAARIQAHVQALPAPSPLPVNPAPIPVANDVRRADVNAAQGVVVQALNQAAAQQGQVPVVLPSNNRYLAQRSGRTWFVSFNGTVIAIGPTKRRARAIANAGNELLRRLLKAGFVDPTSVLNQWQAWLIEAQDPNSTIAPLLQSTPVN